MNTTTTFVCPKCHADMRIYERNGVTVEQCTDCRGLFLDRGELERLIQAEDRFYAAREPERSDSRRRDDDRGRYDRDDRDDRDRRYDDRARYDDRTPYASPGQPQKKRSSFLGELLDFG